MLCHPQLSYNVLSIFKNSSIYRITILTLSTTHANMFQHEDFDDEDDYEGYCKFIE